MEERDGRWLSRPRRRGRPSACRSCGCAGATTERGSDLVAGEEPLEIRIDGERVAVTMRTPVPGQDAELALGFLLAEGDRRPPTRSLASPNAAPSEGDGGVADVLLRPGAQPADGWQRDFYATSSCGICGKQSIDAVRAAAAVVPDGPQVATATLSALPDALRARQRVFDRTGGLHAAALFTAAGDLIARARGRRPPQRGRQGWSAALRWTACCRSTTTC